MGLLRPRSILWKTSLLLAFAGLCPFTHGATIYVDARARGSTGASWQDALNSLQDALLLAYFSEKPVEIRVAQGVYRPDRGLGITPGDRSASFELMNGVTIKGGYAGTGRPDPHARDLGAYGTILSGDIGVLDQPDDNSYHVATGSGTDSTAVLDGCTITAANGELGGGMVNDAGSPTIIDCTFQDNVAAEGAGLHNINDSHPVLNRCVFFSNAAAEGGGAMYNHSSSPILSNCTFTVNRALLGGAMFNDAQSNAALTSCEFRASSAPGAGGALYNSQSQCMLADCTFEENSTAGSGAALANDRGELTLLKCVLRANSAAKNGAVIYNLPGGKVTAINCLFSGNSATVGGGVWSGNGTETILSNCTFTRNFAQAGGALYSTLNAQATLANCILWGDTPHELDGNAGATDIVHSNVQGFSFGESDLGNMNADPLFADPNGDYHLKSQAGRWDPAAMRWVVDPESSPCIDAGHPDDRTGFEPFPNGNRINMGAYGGTFEASLSPFQPSQPSPAAGKALNPIPAEGALTVSTDVVLSWTAGLGAVAHDVYLGTDSNTVTLSSRDHPFGVLVSVAQTGISYDPGNLAYGQYYFWRVDELDSQGNTTKGDVWTFKTPPQAVVTSKASHPIPEDGAIGISTNVILNWTTGTDAVAHDVHFGITFDQVAESSRGDPAGVLVSVGQNGTTYDPPGTLAYGQSYYWRVDEIDNQSDITKGDVWTFKTLSSKGRSCFTPDTPVWIDGALVPIAELRPAGNGTGTMAVSVSLSALGTVDHLREHEGSFPCYDVYLETGNRLSVASCHYFMTEAGQWIALQDLRAGTRLRTASGSVTVTAVYRRAKPYVGKVYNLKIKDSDHYLVGKDALIARDY
ncbi:MAG: right-handed parallel beta-helix repeat-containing protein [Sedimentisphaerales bacterium]|nr:right-handed parallel beta-helix repeat-containing protein [Sedimentisphaerales bacterium]